MNNTTNQLTPEHAAELVTQIIHPGDDEAASALAALVSAVACVADEGTRQEIAAAVAERAYTRTDAFGDAVLAFTRGSVRQPHAASNLEETASRQTANPLGVGCLSADIAPDHKPLTPNRRMMQSEILTPEKNCVMVDFREVPFYEEDGVGMYSVVEVDGLPGSCAICHREVPAVARIESTEIHADNEHRHTTELFLCRDDAPARAAILFDNPGRFELFNGILQPAPDRRPADILSLPGSLQSAA